MLQEDPNLFQLYKNLVVSGVVSAEEFWASRVNKDKEANTVNKQDIGISAAFLVYAWMFYPEYFDCLFIVVGGRQT